jgi:hypothetical protein
MFNMAQELVSYNSSVPTNFNDSINRTVTATPILLAEFGLSIPTSNTDVVLSGSIGFRSTLGVPEMLIKVLRGSTVVASTLSSPVALGEFINITLSFVDRSLPAGYYVYRLTAELTTSSITTNASVVGPVSLIAEGIKK